MGGQFRRPEAELHWSYHTGEQMGSFPKPVSSGNIPALADYKLKLQKVSSAPAAAADFSDDDDDNSKQVLGSSRRFREAAGKVKAKAKAGKRKAIAREDEDEEAGPDNLEGLGLGVHEKDLAVVVDELKTTPRCFANLSVERIFAGEKLMRSCDAVRTSVSPHAMCT